MPLQHYWRCLERAALPSQSIWLVAADTDLDPPAPLLDKGGIFVQRGLGARSKQSYLVEAHGAPPTGVESMRPLPCDIGGAAPCCATTDATLTHSPIPRRLTR